MSRHSAAFIFIDGTSMYGLCNGTVDSVLPSLFPTVDKRNAFWEDGWPWEDPCGCAGEPCLILEGWPCFADDGVPRVWASVACRAHGRYLGPSNPREGAESDIRTVNSVFKVHREEPGSQWHDFIMARRPRLPRSFRQIVVPWIERILKRPPTAEEIGMAFVWTD